MGIKDVNHCTSIRNSDPLLDALRRNHAMPSMEEVDAMIRWAGHMYSAVPMRASHPRADKRCKKLGRDA